MGIFQVCQNCKYFIEHSKGVKVGMNDSDKLKDGDCIDRFPTETKYYKDTCKKWEI